MRGVVAFAVLALACAPAFAQHLGEREQWQPQVMPADARLDQVVEIEILGRAAVPALEMLSEATGVSLTVAPENLDTVGERKLTVISKGLTLKAIMVQLPWALQEAHWDIDDSGEESVYLLHRNSSPEMAAGQAQLRRFAAWQEKRTGRNRQCIDEVRRALAMSPGRLAELEKRDLFLARAARDPEFRALMEALLALPDPQMEALTDTGRLRLTYADAPPAVKQAVEVVVAQTKRMIEWVGAWPPEMQRPPGLDGAARALSAMDLQHALKNGEQTELVFEMNTGGGRDVQYGVLMYFGDCMQVVVPARYPLDEEMFYQFLLTETGDALASAREATQRLNAEWERVAEALEPEENHRPKPSDERLREAVALPAGEYGVAKLSDLQAWLSDRTGLSIVSDYFTNETVPVPSDASRPLGWQLDAIAPNRFEWEQAGACLLFHRVHWHSLAGSELPESLILEYRQRLKAHGRFSLDDVLQFATLVEARPSRSDSDHISVPDDLSEAGLDAVAEAFERRLVLLYVALTPEERAAAEAPGRLRFSDLSARRRGQLREILLPADSGRVWLFEASRRHPAIMRTINRLLQPGAPDLGPAVLSVRRSSTGSANVFELSLRLGTDDPEAWQAIVRLPEVQPGSVS